MLACLAFTDSGGAQECRSRQKANDPIRRNHESLLRDQLQHKGLVTAKVPPGVEDEHETKARLGREGEAAPEAWGELDGPPVPDVHGNSISDPSEGLLWDELGGSVAAAAGSRGSSRRGHRSEAATIRHPHGSRTARARDMQRRQLVDQAIAVLLEDSDEGDTAQGAR